MNKYPRARQINSGTKSSRQRPQPPTLDRELDNSFYEP